MVVALPTACLLCGLVVVSGCADQVRSTGDIDNLLSRARSMGLSTTAEEANSKLKTATDNAAPSLLRIEQDKSIAGLARQLFFSKDIKTSREIMSKIGSRSSMFSEVMKHSGYAPPRDWRQGAEMRFPELSLLRATSMFFCGRAKLRSWEGNGDFAIKDMATASRLIPYPYCDQTIIGGLLQASLIAFWSSTAAEIASRQSTKQLAALAQIAGDISYVDYRSAFGSEIVMARVEIENVRTGKMTISQLSGETSKHAADRVAPQFADAGELVTLGFLVEVAEAWSDWRRVQQLDDQLEKKMEEKRPEYIFPIILVPMVGPFKIAEVRTNALIDTTKIGIAALQLRNRTGKWPTLEEAAITARARKTDPFTGKPYGYRPSATDLIVYSMGPDGRDDGAAKKGPNRTTYDVAQFRVMAHQQKSG
jgi:hypothetical protein